MPTDRIWRRRRFAISSTAAASHVAASPITVGEVREVERQRCIGVLDFVDVGCAPAGSALADVSSAAMPVSFKKCRRLNHVRIVPSFEQITRSSRAAASTPE
jgi:hypothetical protein